MINRNPAGRDTDEGFLGAVEDKTAKELLLELVMEVKKLRLALVLAETAHDLGDLNGIVTSDSFNG